MPPLDTPEATELDVVAPARRIAPVAARRPEPPAPLPYEPPRSTLTLKLWTGYCFLLVPLPLDWDLAQATVATPCGPLGQGTIRCRFPIEARPKPHIPGKSVQLYKTPDSSDDPPDILTLPQTVVIDFLEADAELTITETADDLLLNVEDGLWINIRPNGSSSWVQGWNDLTALGLTPAG